MMERLLLFAKVPRRGAVKTRLVPPLDEGQALELYRAFLSDQIRFARSTAPGRDVELCLDRPWAEVIEAGPAPTDVRSTLQGPGDLGQRLHRAFRRAADEQHLPTVVIATDAPTLPRTLVETAFSRLADGCSAVISPAEDGGYVLLGLAEPRQELFRDMPWGGERIFELTRLRAAESGLAWAELPPWYDVDDRDGLRRLIHDLRRDEARQRAPETAHCIDTLVRTGGLEGF